MSLFINPANSDDITELCTLLHSLFSQEAEFSPNTELQTRALQQVIDNPHIGIIFVARQNHSVVGMVSVLFTLSTALGAEVGLLEDLVVTPNARGLGIGKALLEHVLAFADTRKLARISLLTDADNAAAQRLYQQAGFQRSNMACYRWFNS